MMLRNGIDLSGDRTHPPLGAQSPAYSWNVYSVRASVRNGYSAAEKAEHLAGAFAAKEAFAKALGTGIRGFSLCEVEVLHDTLGAPYFALSGKAAALAEARALEFTLSITHTGTLAAAMVTAIEKGDATL